MTVQRPRAFVKLFVPNVGTAQERTQQEQIDDVTQLIVRPRRVELFVNNHNEADEATIEGTYDDMGVDPRFMRNGELYVYMDDTEDGILRPAADNLRFVGICVEVKRVLGLDEKSVHIKAQDYTCLFLNHKGGYPPDGVPTYQDTLITAWQRVCDHTGYFDLETKSVVSTVQRLRDRIDFVGVDGSLTIGSSVSSRLAKLGRFDPHGTVDAWAIWQTAVGSLGLISFIRGDRCIVTTATDFYTGDAPPRLIWGFNVDHIEENRDQNALSAKNVGILSHNPLTHQTMESFYPPLADVTPKGKGKKKIGASALGPGVVVRSEDYEVFDCPMPITDQATLDRFTQRVWEERSRQELKGTVRTAYIEVPRLSSSGTNPYSLLTLQAGDRIRVEIDRDALTTIQRLPSIQARVQALIVGGYSDTMAEFIAKNLNDIVNVSPEMQVHSVRVVLEVSGLGAGNFNFEIQYLNRIEVSGSGQAGTGKRTAALSSQS